MIVSNTILKTYFFYRTNFSNSYYSSSIVNIQRYLVETDEDEFISAAGDSGLTFSS